MSGDDDYAHPVGWYAAAGLLAACGAGLDWVLWILAAKRPDFPAEPFDYVLIAITVALFAGAAGCVRVGIGFKRKEAWTGRFLGWVYAFSALVALLGLASALAKLARRFL